MKRYLLFKGDEHYPSAGWQDFVGDFDTVAEAGRNAKNCDWCHIVDTQTKEIIRQYLTDDE